MKKLIVTTAACLAVTLTIQSADLRAVYSIPATRPLLAPIATAAMSTYWILMAVAGAQAVMAEACEPLENYRAGIQRVYGTTSASYLPADSTRYPDRELEAQRTCEFDPRSGIWTWWIETIWTITFPDGTSDIQQTFSHDPPAINDFTNQDTHYHRVASSLADYNFNYDAYETITCYCIRLGATKFWGRPVTAIMGGMNNLVVWENDISIRHAISVYEDKHYIFLAFGQMHFYKPHRVNGMLTEMETAGVVTTLGTPN